MSKSDEYLSRFDSRDRAQVVTNVDANGPYGSGIPEASADRIGVFVPKIVEANGLSVAADVIEKELAVRTPNAL